MQSRNWCVRAAGTALCVALAAPLAGADGAVLDADRPDLAEGPSALEPGSAQLELGATRRVPEAGGTASERLDSVGEMLLRIGLSRGWEARLVLPSWHLERRVPPRPGIGGPQALERRGFGDAALGVKRDLPSPRPELAFGLIAECSLPVGVAPFGGRPGAGVTFAAALASAPGDWCGNLGYARSSGEDELLATVSFQRAVARTLAAFGEIAWLGGDGEPLRAAGAGLLWQLGARTRLDVRVGGESASGAVSPLVGLGVVQRW